MQFRLHIIALLLHVLLISANVEKQIFVAEALGSDLAWQQYREELLNKGIPRITPKHSSLKRDIHAAFPSSPDLHEQKQAWFLLDDLEPGRRYEIRASFGAMQPCDLNQSVAGISDVLSNPKAKEQLEDFILKGATQASSHARGKEINQLAEPVLYRIVPTANFFTLDPELMRKGHIVTFDFTLDPFLLNVFPASLVPTAIYIAIIAVIALVASKFAKSSISSIAKLESDPTRNKYNRHQNKND